MGPQEIAQFLEMNENTVRARLAGLLRKGLISRPYYGKYVITPIHGAGVISGGPRAQNVVMQVKTRVLESDEVHLELGGHLSLQIWFGMKRQQITYRIGVPFGVDLLGLVLVHHIVDRELRARGYEIPPDEAWLLRDCEFFTDYNGFKLEGLQAATFTGMKGQLEKYYMKGSIRREVRTGDLKGVRLPELRALLEGGVDAAQTHRRLDLLEQKVGELTDAIKGGNRLVQGVITNYFRREDPV